MAFAAAPTNYMETRLRPIISKRCTSTHISSTRKKNGTLPKRAHAPPQHAAVASSLPRLWRRTRFALFLDASVELGSGELKRGRWWPRVELQRSLGHVYPPLPIRLWDLKRYALDQVCCQVVFVVVVVGVVALVVRICTSFNHGTKTYVVCNMVA